MTWLKTHVLVTTNPVGDVLTSRTEITGFSPQKQLEWFDSEVINM